MINITHIIGSYVIEVSTNIQEYVVLIPVGIPWVNDDLTESVCNMIIQHLVQIREKYKYFLSLIFYAIRIIGM